MYMDKQERDDEFSSVRENVSWCRQSELQKIFWRHSSSSLSSYFLFPSRPLCVLPADPADVCKLGDEVFLVLRAG